jgi:hypothetical protein
MNVDEAIDALQSVASSIFPATPHLDYDPETRMKKLCELMKNILRIRGIPQDRRMQETSEVSVGCKVYV